MVTEPVSGSRSGGRLLLAGAAAGPVFVLATGTGVITRRGFDLTRLPISALSLGPMGWTQVLTFVASGLLAVAGAVGLRRSMGGRGSTWGPIMIGCYGLGQIVAGLFRTDPALGFPAGAPAGTPDTLSWHAIVHATSAMLSMTSAIIAGFVFARRYAGQRWRMSVLSATAAVAIVVSLAIPDQGSFGLRLAVACVISSAWLTWTMLRTSAATRI